MDLLEQLSASLADRLAAVAESVVTLDPGERHASGILWQPDVIIASAEAMGGQAGVLVRAGAAKIPATRAGSDPTTNVAVFRLETPLPGIPLGMTPGIPLGMTPGTPFGGTPGLPPGGPSPEGAARWAAQPRAGSLAMIVGADSRGAATGRLAMVHETGPEWHAMAGGRIDALIRLDARLGRDEGGLVLDASGAFLGMATAGPGRRALVIPAATIARVAGLLLTGGRIARGWLGVGLQSVAIAEGFRAVAGQGRGAMVLQLDTRGPAEQAGVLPGDILLALDGHRFGRGRRIVTLMGPERIGHPVTLRILRGAAIQEVIVTIGARPGA